MLGPGRVRIASTYLFAGSVFVCVDKVEDPVAVKDETEAFWKNPNGGSETAEILGPGVSR